MISYVFKIFLITSILLTGCSHVWKGTVRYVINGTADNVEVYYEDDWLGVECNNVRLPFDSGPISVNAHDDSPFDAYVEVTNRTKGNEEVDLYIFIDNDERAHKNAILKPGESAILYYDVEVM